MELGYIGLGKMGLNMCLRLKEKGNNIIAFNRSEEGRIEGRNQGLFVADSLEEMVSKLKAPKTVWIMVSHSGVDAVLDSLVPLLSKGDTIIDGGNSPYIETEKRAVMLAEKGLRFLDAGVSNGPGGARNGACVMVGGERELYDEYEKLFADIAVPEGYGYMGKSGAGHFVKMVHNGIEYGIMQAIAEGFAVMKKSNFKLDLKEVVRVYQHKSVIESRLVGWLGSAFDKHGEDLEGISGMVSHSGEGQWTVETAKSLGVSAPVIEASFKFRVDSGNNPSYTGKIVSALRNEFGGHDVSEKKG